MAIDISYDALQVKPQVMLLCGEDLVESFLKPGVWKPEQLDAIFKDHGVVCISRCILTLDDLC